MDSTPIDIYLEPGWWRTTLEHDVRVGLTSTPRSIPAKWFYDEVGSQLFDQITKLDEYYPFRAEREILRDRATEIVAAAGADTLVELGSGTDYPGISVHGIVGDFDRHIPLVPISGTGMIAFLGSTIGNFEPRARAKFIGDVVEALAPGGTFLLGTDLVKAPGRLWDAYNDAEGVTAEFNLNMLRMINRELNADFELEQFAHTADWDAENEWIDIRVRSMVEQSVTVADLDLVAVFGEGEEMRTEISAKFRLDGIADELEAAGLSIVEQWTDTAGDFALTLARKS